MYVCMYVRMYLRMNVCKHGFNYVSACIHACEHVCRNACIHVSTYLCMFAYIYIYIYIYGTPPPPPPQRSTSSSPFHTLTPHSHTHRDTHTNTPPQRPTSSSPFHALTPHSIHTETHTHPPTHPHAQEELADVPFCGWVNPTPRIIGTAPGPVPTGTTGTSCTGGFQDSKIPRLLESLFLESWNLGFPRYNLYRLYRFVPGGVFQDSKKRLPSNSWNLGILDSAGTTCTGCTGLYRAQPVSEIQYPICCWQQPYFNTSGSSISY